MKCLAALVGAIGLGLIAAPPAGAALADEAATSLVVVETSDAEGVGFALDHPRRIVTSSEVVGDAGSVNLTRDDGSAASADVLAVDADSGLAILRSNTAIPPLEETEVAAQADDAVVAVAITLDEEVLEQRTSLAGSAEASPASGWRMEIDDVDNYAGAPVLDDAGDVTAVVGAGAAEGTGIPVRRVASLEGEAGVGELFPERDGFGSAPFVDRTRRARAPRLHDLALRPPAAAADAQTLRADRGPGRRRRFGGHR